MNSKRVINIVALVVGISALGFLIYKVGLQELLDNLLSFGSAFPLILGIELVSNVFSVFGWYYSFEQTERPSYGRLLMISLASLSLAGALPTGQAGEVAKGNMLRGHTGSTEILSSLLIYNFLFNFLTLLLVLLGPIIALIFDGEFTTKQLLLTLAVATASFAVVMVVGYLLYSGVLHKLIGWIGSLRFVPWKPSEKMMKGIKEVDGRMRDIVSRRPMDLLKGSIGIFVGRIFQLLEIYAILYFMDVSDSLIVSMMIYSTTAVANYLLMILPAREGFLEGSSFVVFEMLGMKGADGLALEITRRLRKIAFQVVGIFLMMIAVKDSKAAEKKLAADNDENQPDEGQDS